MKPLKEISFHFKGWTSTNKLRNTMNRWQMNSIKDKERKRFRKLLKDLMNDCQFNTRIDIHIIKRSRLDVDNTSGKFMLDSMQDLEMIKSDAPKNVREITVTHNDTLPADCYVVRFYLAGNDEELNHLDFPSY